MKHSKISLKEIALTFKGSKSNRDVQNKGFHIIALYGIVPRSTGNTNNGTRELTLKCKLKCYFKPMNNPLGVSPSKGKQGTTRGKEKIF